MAPDYSYSKPLLPCRILSRPNRFIAEVILSSGEKVRAHCPVSGRIGGFTLDGQAGLVSGPYLGRGTSHTLEAIALEAPSSPTFQWIGINQNQSNAIIEAYLKKGLLAEAFPEASAATVRREKKLQHCRIDFLVDDSTFLEVKTPLLTIHARANPTIRKKTFKDGNPSERLPKQMKAMGEAIQGGFRGAMLVHFQYHNTASTSLEEQVSRNIFPDPSLQNAFELGLEQWVCFSEVTPEGVSFRGLKQLH